MELRERRADYRVEGEVGRFEFALYEACAPGGDVLGRGETWFPPRQPREWHKTEGFREEALCLESSRRSYRDNTAHLNRYRRQWEGGTPVTTLRDNAQKEGARVLEFLEHHSQRVLTDHGFERDGRAPEAVVDDITAGTDRRQKAAVVDEQLTAMVEEMGRRGFSPAQIASARQRAAGGIYEDPRQCTNVSVDDVSVKQQKVHRERTAAVGTPPDGSPASDSQPVAVPAASDTSKSARPQVANTVARIEQDSKHFTLSAGSLGQVLRFVLAFLLHNGLLGGRLHLFTDGYRSLQDTLVAFFAWHPRVWLVLDWYHVVKKFKEDLSRACGAREFRNRHLATLVRFLWYGMVTEARRYLDTIPAAEVKDAASIEAQ